MKILKLCLTMTAFVVLQPAMAQELLPPLPQPSQQEIQDTQTKLEEDLTAATRPPKPPNPVIRTCKAGVKLVGVPLRYATRKTKAAAAWTGHKVKGVSDKLEANGTVKTAQNASIGLQLFNNGCQAAFWVGQFIQNSGTRIKLF